MFFPVNFQAGNPMQSGGFNMAPQIANSLMSQGQGLQHQGIENQFLPTNLSTQNMATRLNALAPYYTSSLLTPNTAMMATSKNYRNNMIQALQQAMQLGGGNYNQPGFQNLNNLNGVLSKVASSFLPNSQQNNTGQKPLFRTKDGRVGTATYAGTGPDGQRHYNFVPVM